MVIAGQHSFAGQQLPSRGLAFFLGGIFLFALCWLLAGQLERRSRSHAPADGDAPDSPPRPHTTGNRWFEGVYCDRIMKGRSFSQRYVLFFYGASGLCKEYLIAVCHHRCAIGAPTWGVILFRNGIITLVTRDPYCGGGCFRHGHIAQVEGGVVDLRPY